jgi:membrane-bound lytic murein transglycosylase F
MLPTRFKIALLILAACFAAMSIKFSIAPLADFKQSGRIAVLSRNGPTTYYEDHDDKPVGIEHDLVTLFAKQLGVEADFIFANTHEGVLTGVEKRRAHFAAAGLIVSAAPDTPVRFAPPYQTIRQHIIYNKGGPRPSGFKDLEQKIMLCTLSSDSLPLFRKLEAEFPGLKWEEVDLEDSVELLERVANQTDVYALVDSNVMELARKFYPAVDIAFTLGESQKLAWAFPKDGDQKLFKLARTFFAGIQRDGTLKKLLDRYYGHIRRLDNADVVSFLQKMHHDLRHYRPMFYQAETLTGIDWRLIAALGYQESKWDPLATSPTNVRGLMMLTEDTADRLGVSDRLDAEQSVIAGAQYLQLLKDSLPERIPEPDRTWIAMAAYNTGLGHLEDARIIAQRLGLNPNSWTDLKSTLPLLRKGAYFNTVKHGYARGGEAVIMVENVRTYYDILVKYEKSSKASFAPFGITAF